MSHQYHAHTESRRFIRVLQKIIENAIVDHWFFIFKFENPRIIPYIKLKTGITMKYTWK